MSDWSDYQEEIADFFRHIGMQAETNVTVNGVRTSHDVDVLVRSNHLGFEISWVVECKSWRRPVTKLHVFALREIVSDLGADKGILMAESGYQRGAIEAAQLTNVQLGSLAELKDSCSAALGMAALRAIQDRLDVCEQRYWDMSGLQRVSGGLRSKWYEHEWYSGNAVIQAVNFALDAAFRQEFPVMYDEVWGFVLQTTTLRTIRQPNLSSLFDTPHELARRLDKAVADLERRLDHAEARLSNRADS